MPFALTTAAVQQEQSRTEPTLLPFLRSPTRFIIHYVAARPWIFLVLGLLVAGASLSSIGVQYAMKLLIDAMTGGVRARGTVYAALAVFLCLVMLESLLQRMAALTAEQRLEAFSRKPGR